ncbi:MAG TPA: 16S rRNA (uracil(1498)-N(3))-methyltransferase [Actinomycetota bacterium]|nr:16S rRNA (uracil(1498)-N(3))-methyltransferase [Actinomycetota bacterium]
MTAPHFFVPSVASDRVSLTGDEARHAARVLRITPGESVTISDGRGTVVEGVVTDAAASKVDVEVRARRFVEAARPTVVVYPAIPKAGKLDFVVQKLTELGVDRIAPWVAARSVVRWDAAKVRTNGDRWRAIAWESSKQSRRAWLPQVDDPTGFPDVAEGTLVLHEEATVSMRAALPGPGAEVIFIVVGPEGSLDAAEIDRFVAKGAMPVTLGPTILRTETASIVGAALALAAGERLG